jgi:hypothetical protein
LRANTLPYWLRQLSFGVAPGSKARADCPRQERIKGPITFIASDIRIAIGLDARQPTQSLR